MQVKSEHLTGMNELSPSFLLVLAATPLQKSRKKATPGSFTAAIS
jgi:hypothetical protein